MSWHDSQTTLDAFLNPSSPTIEPHESKSPEPQESRAERVETRAESEVWRCEVCGEPSGPFTFQRLRLHPGAVKLYPKGGKWSARADMDHIYNRCLKGLVENLRFLKRLYDDLYYHMYYRKRVGGGRFVIVGVGKAYDDTLYVYGVGRFPREFKGFRVGYVEVEDVEALERFHYHLQSVPEDVIEEALREPETEENQVGLSEFVEE
jgi:hypothetical protein